MQVLHPAAKMVRLLACYCCNSLLVLALAPLFDVFSPRQLFTAILTHKVLCGIAPRYLGPLNRVTDISGRRSLRSSGTNRLVVPPFRLSTIGSRAFPVAAAKIWNALPDSLVSLHNITFVLSTPSENILVPEILLIALQCT